MSELLRDVTEIEQELFALGQLLDECNNRIPATTVYNGAKVLGRIREIMEADSKYPLAPVSSTLDQLLDKYFDPADTKRRTDFVESDLGEILHKGEKVMVKIKVVRGEG